MIISDGKKIKVYNGTATTIDSNKIVVVKGKRIVLASNANTDVTKYPLGYTLSSISAGNYGEVLLEGSIQNINTSSYSEGSILYLGTSGNITSTAPTPEIILASVSKSDSLSGAIYFKVFVSSSGVVPGVPAGGNAGDILAKASATDYDTEWIENYTSAVKHIVKLGENINKGQAVYVSSADGTNMVVSKASNATEATSSKTMGLLAASGVTNDQVYVITEGLLAELDTSTATNAGDPVWLGTNGNLIYGLTNKPYAPAHLVFIGIVTRKQSNNGEIFVKVQNGFELKEIHDVDLYTTTPINGHILGYNGTLWVNKTIAGWLGYTPYDASNPSNYIDSSALTPYLTSAAAASTYATTSALAAKQDTLVSGTNIKSINGDSILGSGNEVVFNFDRAKFGFEGFSDFNSIVTALNGVDPAYAVFFSGTGAGIGVSALPSVRATNQQGFIQPTTGTVATGYAGIFGSLAANNFIAFGGGVVSFITSTFIPTLSTSLERYRISLGFGSIGSNANDSTGVFFTYDEGGIQNGTIASPNWQCVTTVSSVRTLTTTSVAVSNTAWQKFSIEINATGTSVEFYIDNVSVATHTTNIPTGTSQLVTPKIQIAKSVGTTSRSFFSDYIGYKQTFTTARI
jgi:hypothetical protein